MDKIRMTSWLETLCRRGFTIVLLLLLTMLSAQAQPTAQPKVSRYLGQLVEKERRATSRHRAPQAREASVCAFVKTTDTQDDILAEYGLTPLARFGHVAIVDLPLHLVPTLTTDRRVIRMEAGPSAQVLMDGVVSQVNAAPVYAGENLPQAFTGKGVVMGVQDVGFDLTHPNFYDPSTGRLRVKTFWDQLSTDTLGSPLFVGADYVGEAAIEAYGHSRDAHLTGHGTHTLGIAAGSGAGTAYQGMAPEADICVVSNAVSSDVELIDSLDLYKYTTATDAMGFKYMFDYADAVGQPCVISFSEGSHQDLYGDDQLYYEALSSMVGPGHIIVCAAGNEGHLATYLDKPAESASGGTFIRSNDHNYIYLTLRASTDFTLRLTAYDDGPSSALISTHDVFSQPDSLYKDTLLLGEKSYAVSIAAYRSCYNEDDIVVECYASTTGNFGIDQPFSIEALGQDTRVEFFNGVGEFCSNDLNPALVGQESSHSIYTPASCSDVICVGSTSYRPAIDNYNGLHITTSWGSDGVRANFSGVGPTLQGLTKPDVMAPGVHVISSYSSYYMEANPDAFELRNIISKFSHADRTYAWAALIGTSMAAPVVGGAIALWLQAKPDLSPDEVKDVFSRTCRRMEGQTTWPDNHNGWGEIDVYKGLLYLMGYDGIADIAAHQPRQSRMTLTKEGRLVIVFSEPNPHNFSVSVYAVGGQKVATQSFDGGQDRVEVDLTSLPRGVYAVQLNCQDAGLSGSTLVRR